MGLITPLAGLLGLEVENVVARARAAAIIYGLLALMLLLACVFLILAGYLALADVFTPIIAALIMGGAFLLLALALYAGALIGRGRREKDLADRRRASESSAFITTAAMTALPMVMRAPLVVKLGLPAAAIAAFALLRDQSDKD